jgi:hypothetical protein
MGHKDAVKYALLAVMEASCHEWTHEYVHSDGTIETMLEYAPALGSYVPVWRCKGTEPYKNEKGNKAKCPFSQEGKFFDATHGAPGTCGCGSATETRDKWTPVSAVKDRYNAVRAVAWYAEEQKDGAFKPVSLSSADGNKHVALVELNATLNLFVDGQTMKLAANFDAIKALGDEQFAADYKTTGMSLSALYFSQFSPNVQVDFYGTFAAAMSIEGHGAVLGGVKGVVVEGMQFIQSGVRFGAHVYRFTHEQRMEISAEFGGAIVVAQSMADNYGVEEPWPRNRASCRMCSFKAVCSAPPAAREILLAEHYDRARWNPITRTSEPIEEPKP